MVQALSMTETHEDLASRTARMIPASQVQPGKRIHHVGWSATEGDYEVVGVKTVYGGAISIRIKATSQQGVEFQTSVLYDAEAWVEVVST